DLTTDAALIGWDDKPGTSVPISLRVQNQGNWRSSASTVEVYDGPPGVAGTHRIGSLPVTAIGPGGYQELSGTLNLTGLSAAASGLNVLYVKLDPAGKQLELNENNNLVRVG